MNGRKPVEALARQPAPSPGPDGELRRHVVILTSATTGRQSLTDATLRSAAEARQEAEDWRRAGHVARIGVIVFLPR